MLKFLGAATLAATLATGLPAHAQDADNDRDLSCMAIAAIAGAQSDNPELAKQASVMFIYFLGRVEGRSPKLDVENALRSQVSRLTAARLKSEAGRCGSEMIAKSEQLKAMGSSMQSMPDLKPDT